MLRRTQLDGLRAELASLSTLLSQAQEANDPVGILQYQYRRKAIEREVETLERLVTTHASVALYFGGSPVMGSKGISAEFAGEALEKFQDLVTRTYAKAEFGVLGRRGPIPLKSATRLMVTELARGSFGFVLDEMSDQDDLDKTSLKYIVEEVDKTVQDVASSDESLFENAIEKLDGRTLTGLRDFFITLDSHNASLRIVDDERDITLDHRAVDRGRARTEATTIEEADQYYSGYLIGFLPQHKKFEMRTLNGDLIYGTVSKLASEQFQSLFDSGEEPLGKLWKVSLIVRTVAPVRRNPRMTYHLNEFLDQPGSDS